MRARLNSKLAPNQSSFQIRPPYQILTPDIRAIEAIAPVNSDRPSCPFCQPVACQSFSMNQTAQTSGRRAAGSAHYDRQPARNTPWKALRSVREYQTSNGQTLRPVAASAAKGNRISAPPFTLGSCSCWSLLCDSGCVAESRLPFGHAPSRPCENIAFAVSEDSLRACGFGVKGRGVCVIDWDGPSNPVDQVLGREGKTGIFDDLCCAPASRA